MRRPTKDSFHSGKISLNIKNELLEPSRAKRTAPRVRTSARTRLKKWEKLWSTCSRLDHCIVNASWLRSRILKRFYGGLTDGEYDAEPVELSEEVQSRLDEIDGMVGSLSKSFLNAVNLGIGNWGNGTNSEMAADIVETLGSRAKDEESDLLEEYTVIKSVYRSRWGGRVGSSDEEEEGEEEAEGEEGEGEEEGGGEEEEEEQEEEQ
ncbi:hypothetical protein DFP72DRAFT_461221 [Ephemerocybe angulata]|uniref:Uncharacterized protein n=1 Tax=Ephemerocybe angulata TaxID=980116 RepID=A0A8H6HU90_9AGAR|nr:hypothetical protein DFP72DRAFT_461221 [Tulosesus angulatus]